MMTTAFHTNFADLPDILPVFPLDGVLLLPRGQLPLNIFEPRYLAMVEDSLSTHRLIGMIQPRANDTLYNTGCAGRITNFSETDDGRYLITLKGVCRFHIDHELAQDAKAYRSIRPDWRAFERDTDPAQELNIDRKKLCTLLGSYFEMEGMNCDWDAIHNASDDKLMTCLSMACPLDSGEKQALLEAKCCKTRADLFMTLLEMAIRDISRERPPCPSKCN